MKKLTVQQAFQAMVNFLEGYYERTKSDDIGSLLGDLQMLNDGNTADPAAWHRWVKNIEKIINTPEEGINRGT